MSELSEHTSEEAETELNAVNQSSEQSKSEASILNNQTEPAMLEDEEMPTYISVSSPSRREDSDIVNTKEQERVQVEEDHSRSPYPSDDQGGGSVYVLSSGEETDQRPYNDEDNDDYGESDDGDDVDMENDRDNAMLEDEEEEEEEDEDDDDEHILRLRPDDEDDIETDCEPEWFDRVSDDFILNNRLKTHPKERSFSLQDLSICKNNVRTPYSKKRRSLNIMRQNNLGSQENPVMYPVINRRQSLPVQYQHVQSKVKNYIKKIKEQNRRSMERRTKDQECPTKRNCVETKYNDIGQLKPTVTKTIKDYAEKAIKDLERDEDGSLVYNIAQIVENGEDNKIDSKLVDAEHKNIRRDDDEDIYCNLLQNDKGPSNFNEKAEKRNGSVELNVQHIQCQQSADRNNGFSDKKPVCLDKGHHLAMLNFHNIVLRYDEYIRGPTNNNKNADLNMQTNAVSEEAIETEVYNDVEMIDSAETEDETPCTLKIENVKSIRSITDEPKNDQDDDNLKKINPVNLELHQLRTQLNQKTALLEHFRDAHHKILTENLKMKQELDALKQSLAKYENDNKPCETKVVSVQTETIPELVLTEEKKPDIKGAINKISSSSVASTISSIDQWADSVCSPAISIKPPDLTTVLNSDDSMVLIDGTPRKTARPLSRAFITSSRILQTLSNITQGKSKPESPLVRGTKKRRNENSTEPLLNVDCNSPIHASSSKKRKATDLLGTSTFVQPFKVPHTTEELENKNTSSTADVEFKYPEEHPEPKSEHDLNPTIDNTNRSASPTHTQSNTEETDDQEDNVKCFVYREDESSKDNSFLIQADDPGKEREINEKGRIRECGPYLLGNVEVRMSEVNGTISIWGKEVGQESTTENEEELDESVKSVGKKACHCWQTAPLPRYNGSPLLSSTSKKPKVPGRFSASGHSPRTHSASLNAIKASLLLSDTGERNNLGNPCSPCGSAPAYQSCNCGTCRKGSPICKRISASQEKLHSCYTHRVDSIEEECNCSAHQERQQCNGTPSCSKDKFGLKGNRRNACKSSADTSKHLHESVLSSAGEYSGMSCKHHTCRCSSHNTIENCQQKLKCCNSCTSISNTCRSASASGRHYGSMDRQSCNSSTYHDDDEEPLLPHKRSHETPETRQRRLSGKKVRGILMDLLRGCGDCRSTGNAGGNRSAQQEKEAPYLAAGVPHVKVTPCPNPEPTCSNSAQTGDRCCHAYARRIETQLEEFRIEMEKVRSRSDAILDMLSMLHSADMN